MPDEDKKAMVELTARYNVPLIEDDVYGDLHFGERRPKPLKAWDTDGRVLLCSSFGKTLAPSLRKTSAALSSGGIATPVPVQERLRVRVLTARVSEGKRVRVPMRSAICWSSEMVFRKPPPPGCGAAVRKQLSAGWPPSTLGWETPEKTVKRSRCSCRWRR